MSKLKQSIAVNEIFPVKSDVFPPQPESAFVNPASPTLLSINSVTGNNSGNVNLTSSDGSVAITSNPENSSIDLKVKNYPYPQGTVYDFVVTGQNAPTFAAGEEYILFPTDVGGYVEFELTLFAKYKAGATDYGEITAKFSMEHNSPINYNNTSIKLLSLGQSGTAQNLTNLFTFTAYLTNAPYVINGVTLPNSSIIYTVKLNNTLNYAGTTNSIYAKVTSNSVVAYNGMTGGYTPTVLAIVSTPIPGAATVVKADTSLFQSSLDANNFGTNPTTGLTTLTNIQYGNLVSNPVVNSYIALVPLNCSGASVRLNLILQWTGNEVELEATIFRNTVTINGFTTITGSINTIVLFNTLFTFNFDNTSYVALKSLTAITGLAVAVRYVSDTPTPVANIPLIGTIYTPASATLTQPVWASTVGVTGSTMMTDPTTGFLRNGSVYSADHSWTSTTTSPAIPANSYILLAALNWNTLSAGCIINFGESDYVNNGQFALHINFQGSVPVNATVLSFNSGGGSVLGIYTNFLANWSIQYVTDNVHNSINVYLVNKNDIFPASATAQSVVSKLDILAISGIPVYWLPLIGSIVTAPPSPITLTLISSSAVNIDNVTIAVNPTSGLTQSLIGGVFTPPASTNVVQNTYFLLNSQKSYSYINSVIEFSTAAGIFAINLQSTQQSFQNKLSIVSYDGNGVYSNYAQFLANFQICLDLGSSGTALLYLKYIGAATIASVIINIINNSGYPINPAYLSKIGTILVPTGTATSVPFVLVTQDQVDGVTLALNPTTGLVRGTIGGTFAVSNLSLTAGEYLALDFAGTSLNTDLTFEIVTAGGNDCGVRGFNNTAAHKFEILSYWGGGTYATLTQFLAAFDIGFDIGAPNAILLKSNNAVTISSIVLYRGHGSPLVGFGNFANILTPYTLTGAYVSMNPAPFTPPSVAAMQSTIDSLTARLEALESPKALKSTKAN